MIDIIIGAVTSIVAYVVLIVYLAKEPYRCVIGWHDDEKVRVGRSLGPHIYSVVKSTCRRCGRVDIEPDGAPFV